MAAGTWIGNYYMLPSGVMATNQWIGNYYVGADGLWVQMDAMESYAYQVLELTNQVRAEAGVAPLTMNTTLLPRADIRGEEITRVMEHTRPDGTPWYTVLEGSGVVFYCAGENIAGGQRTPEQVVTAWANSPGHYANMIEPDFNEIAIACYYDEDSLYKYHWVQLFIGTPSY